MDYIFRAPVWFLIVGGAVFVGAIVMMTNRRGRALLFHSLKEMIRPAVALPLGILAATIVGSAVIASSYATSPPTKGQLSGMIGIFLFGVLYATALTVPRSLPLWILIFVPCWLLRSRIPWFWRWRIAPVVGGVLNLVSAELWNRVVPMEANPERLRGLMLGYYAGATAGGVCMLVIGCIRFRRRSSPREVAKAKEVS